MVRLVQIVFYLAVMAALAWALGLVAPQIVEWVDGKLGLYGSSALILSIIPFGFLISYLLGRRDSGSARDP